MQGVCRLLSDVKVYAANPDQPVGMPDPHKGNLQGFRALEGHAEALEEQDVILAINRSHEYFDHKGMYASSHMGSCESRIGSVSCGCWRCRLIWALISWQEF
jgi:hypothetical protein